MQLRVVYSFCAIVGVVSNHYVLCFHSIMYILKRNDVDFVRVVNFGLGVLC